MHPVLLWTSDEHLSTTKDAFDALRDMIQHSRHSLISERKKAEEAALKQAKGIRMTGDKPMSKEDKAFYSVLSAYTPLLNKYCGYLPRLINYGCLLQLYTLFEDRGAALCNELKNRDETIPLKISDLGKPDFTKIKTYLTKLCGIKYKYWSEIELLEQLRHRIIHNNGHTEDPTLIKRIKQTKGLEMFHYYDDKAKVPIKEQVETSEPFNPDYEQDPDYILPAEQKKKPFFVVKNAYIDHIVPIVAGLFEKAFEEKGFGRQSPFTKHASDAPLIIVGTGKKLKVQVVYQD